MYKSQSRFFKRVIARGGSKVKVFGQGVRPTGKVKAQTTAKPVLVKKEKPL